ncbi:MAG: hypothetical protein CMH49_02205 [Myxococcales bacterium]|nr:hypothetical protein [Myxococcales bacterium]
MSKPSTLDDKQSEEQQNQAVIAHAVEPKLQQDMVFFSESEITQEWQKDQLQLEIDHNLSQDASLGYQSTHSINQQVDSMQTEFDLESTKEWYPPSDRPLAQTPLIEPNDDLSDLKEIRLDQLNLNSKLSLNDEVLTIVTPRLGWRSSDILFILISTVVIILLLLGPLDVVLLMDFEFGFRIFLSFTLLFWLMIFGVYVGIERQQKLVINSEEIAYTSYLPSFLGYFPHLKLFQKTYSLDQLIDVKNESYSSHGFLHESLVFKMKTGGKNILFGTHLSTYERHRLAEQIQAHLIRLQKTKLST